MNNPAANLEALAALPAGGRGRIARIDGGAQLTRRLMGLGLRVGSEVAVLQHRGRGMVLASGDTRIALGADITSHLLVEPTGIITDREQD
jgi:ferrous iron transport protein A